MEWFKQRFRNVFRSRPISARSEADPRRWRPERRKRELPIKVWENTEFYALEREDLEEVAVVAQALDNQWVSRRQLREMLKSSQKNSQLLGLKDIEARRAPLARAEYIRSLITTEQVLINRAFLYNTETVRRDYVQPGESQEAFTELLGSGVIVPYLLKEQVPIQPPKSFDTDKSGFSVDKEAFEKWVQICHETRPHCIRLSWDEQENNNLTNVMVRRFRAWASTLHLVADAGSFDLFMRDLGVPAEDKDRFLKHLRDVARWSIDNSDTLTREEIYKRFVVADETKPVDGKYDPKKPFSGQIKQLADLSYNINLPDALERYALTPIDALPRTALQELTVKSGQSGNYITYDELKRLLQREWFAALNVAGGEFLSSLNFLTLSDVKAIRATDQWAAYMEELRGLLTYPLELDTRGQRIYEQYINFARVLSRFAAKGDSRRLAKWQPALTLVLTIGSAVVSAVWNPLASDFTGRVEYIVTGRVAKDVASVVGRLIIGGVAGVHAQAQLETGMDFMRARVGDAQALLTALQGELDIKQQASDFTVKSEDLYDPNINYSEDIEMIPGGV